MNYWVTLRLTATGQEMRTHCLSAFDRALLVIATQRCCEVVEMGEGVA